MHIPNQVIILSLVQGIYPIPVLIQLISWVK